MDITRPNECTIALAASPRTADKIYNCFFTLLLQTFIEGTGKILRINISNLDIWSKIVAIVVIIIAKIFRLCLIQPEYADTFIIIVLTAFIPYVKTFYGMFLRPKPKGLEVPDNEVPKSAVFAMVVLLALIIILGLCPGLVTNGIYEFVGGIL